MALFVDLVALSNGLHGSVQMDSVALFSWIGWLRHHGILIHEYRHSRLEKKEKVEEWRSSWAEHANRYLENWKPISFFIT